MQWILFAILIQGKSYAVYPQGPFLSMQDCFEARDIFLSTAPKPKVNYEAVCISTDIGNGT